MDLKKVLRCGQRLGLSLAAASLLLSPVASEAQWITTTTNLLNLNFNSDPYGDYAGTATNNVYQGSTNDTVTIADAPGMYKAVKLTATSVAGAGYALLDQYW